MDVHLSAWAYSALLIRPYWSGIQPQPQIGTGRSGPQARISDNDRRRRFACPPRRGTFDEIDLSLLDPADPDDRRMLILAEHPEHAEAIERGEDEVLAAARRRLRAPRRPAHARVGLDGGDLDRAPGRRVAARPNRVRAKARG